MSNTQKRYRLLKDIPDAKAGTELFYDGIADYDYSRTNGDEWFYKKEIVENSPEWFELITEPKQGLSIGSAVDYGAIAVNLCENLRPKISDSEKAFFVAGFQECAKYINNQSNQPIEETKGKDWEIVEYKNTTNSEVFELASVWNNSIYREGFKDYTGEFKNQKSVFNIHSVRRLSDGEVFSVGDVFCEGTAGIFTEEFILCFKIDNGVMLVYVESDGFYTLNSLCKIKPQPPK